MEKNNSPTAIFLKIRHYFGGFDRPKGSFQTASQSSLALEICPHMAIIEKPLFFGFQQFSVTCFMNFWLMGPIVWAMNFHYAYRLAGTRFQARSIGAFTYLAPCAEFFPKYDVISYSFFPVRTPFLRRTFPSLRLTSLSEVTFSSYLKKKKV